MGIPIYVEIANLELVNDLRIISIEYWVDNFYLFIQNKDRHISLKTKW